MLKIMYLKWLSAYIIQLRLLYISKQSSPSLQLKYIWFMIINVPPHNVSPGKGYLTPAIVPWVRNLTWEKGKMSNPPGYARPPPLGLNIDRCIRIDHSILIKFSISFKRSVRHKDGIGLMNIHFVCWLSSEDPRF